MLGEPLGANVDDFEFHTKLRQTTDELFQMMEKERVLIASMSFAPGTLTDGQPWAPMVLPVRKTFGFPALDCLPMLVFGLD